MKLPGVQWKLRISLWFLFPGLICIVTLVEYDTFPTYGSSRYGQDPWTNETHLLFSRCLENFPPVSNLQLCIRSGCCISAQGALERAWFFWLQARVCNLDTLVILSHSNLCCYWLYYSIKPPSTLGLRGTMAVVWILSEGMISESAGGFPLCLMAIDLWDAAGFHRIPCVV